MAPEDAPVPYTLTPDADRILARVRGDVATARTGEAPTMHLYRGDEGERLPGDELGLGITRPEWDALLDDLLELNAARALPGIRAIVTESLARIHVGSTCDHPVAMASATIQALEIASAPGSPRRAQMLAEAAALLAAEIDRQARP